MRLVDRDVGEVGEQPGAAVGRTARGEQVRPLVDEGRGHPAGLEVGVVEHRRRNGMLVDTPRIRNSATARRARRTAFGEVAAAAGQLDQHRVEVRADLGAASAVPPSSRTPAPPGER